MMWPLEKANVQWPAVYIILSLTFLHNDAQGGSRWRHYSARSVTNQFLLPCWGQHLHRSASSTWRVGMSPKAFITHFQKHACFASWELIFSESCIKEKTLANLWYVRGSNILVDVPNTGLQREDDIYFPQCLWPSWDHSQHFLTQ